MTKKPIDEQTSGGETLQHGAGESGFRYWEARKGAGLNVAFGWFAVTGAFPTENRGFGLEKEKWSTTAHLSTVNDFRLVYDAAFDAAPASNNCSVRLQRQSYAGAPDVSVPGNGDAAGNARWAVWRVYRELQNGTLEARDVYLAVQYTVADGVTEAVWWYAKPSELTNGYLSPYDEPMRLKRGEGPPAEQNSGFKRAGGGAI